MAGRKITIEFLGKDTSAGRTASDVSGKITSAGKAAESSSKGFGKASAGLGKLVGAFAGIAVVSKATSFLKDSVAEAREAQKVGALTTQVIKTTGGAAQVSAKQVGDLAGAISAKSGIDDEAIQSGANLLLTFKNIKNEAGKGNDIFSQTTQIMTDMGAAMGKDPKAAAIGLGKALNDPIKGVTALSKVGVTFDDKQKKLIKRLVETGNVAGAQKIILKELKSEFGGAAAASATSGEKAAVAWGNLKEQIGTQLLPVIDKLQGWFAGKLVPAVSKFFAEMKSGEGTGGQVAAVLGTVASVLGTVFGFLSEHRETVVTFVAVLGTMTVAFAALNAVMALNPISLVIIAIAGLVTGLIMAYKKSETFREIVDGSFTLVAKAAQGMWAVIKPVFRFLINYWLTVAGGILRGASIAFGWVPKVGDKLRAAADKFDDFKRDVNRALGDTKDKKKITVTTPGADTAIRKLKHIRDLSGALAFSVGVGFTPGHNAKGTDNWHGGPTWVGEKGPEILNLPRGSQITPNNKAMSAVAGGGGTTINVHFNGLVTNPQAAAREVRKILLDLQRSNGGAPLFA